MGEKVGRAERARQERLTEKPKEQERVKDKQSQFDRVLQKSRGLQKSQPLTQTTKQATEHAVKEGYKREDRGRDDEKKEHKDKDEKGDRGSSSKRGDGKAADQKVVGKGHLKDGRGGGGKEGRGGFSFGQGRRGLTLKQAKVTSRMAQAAMQGKFMQKLQASMAKGVKGPALTQSVLNQLVQYVRVGINKEQQKEIRIDLHEKIFRGLKLKITSRDGKVLVHFMAADHQTRSVFDKNKDDIRKALEKKGILVEDILVT